MEGFLPNSVCPKAAKKPFYPVLGIARRPYYVDNYVYTLVHQVVSLDLLHSLDGLLWLQSGAKVGALFQQHQTTVSRNQKKCAQVFGITLSKSKNKWEVQGDSTLLQLEREVHQVARLQGKSRLRIEVNGWLDSPHFNPAPSGWIVGSSNNLSVPHGIQFLKQSIIDVLLCSLIDLPAESQDLSIIPLNITTEVGLIVLQKYANQERILNLINELKQM